MNDTVRTGADDGDLEAICEDIDTLRKELARLLERVKSGAFANLAGRVEEMSDDACRLYDRALAEGERSAAAVARQVEERPLTSLLIAFGLGFLGGRLILR